MNNKEMFKIAVQRQSFILLDNVGISIKMDTLPTYKKLKLCEQKKYGTHFISRLWCQKLRPLFFPKKQILIDNALAVNEVLNKRMFLKAVLSEGKKWDT